MNIFFLRPPPAQRVGGLDSAIEGLRGALTRAGVTVHDGEPAPAQPADAVHLHGLWQPGYPAVAQRCRARHVPCIVSPHGMLEPWAWRHKWWKKWPYYLLRERALLRAAAAVLATAEPEAARLRQRLPAQRVVMLPLGTEGRARPDYAAARAELGWAPGERVLLYLSRLHPKKGLDLLLHALAAAPGPPGTRLVIVGEGEAAWVAALKRWAAGQASQLPRLDWVGPVWGEARWRYFQGADLFCLPTHSENFGLVVPEAWQTGTPVLTTPGTPWAGELREGRGYRCEPEVASIAAALGAFYAAPPVTPGRREEISAWMQARYTWEILVAAVRGVLSRTGPVKGDSALRGQGSGVRSQGSGVRGQGSGVRGQG